MTTLLDPALDLSLAPLTNTPLTSSDTTFELADQAGDISLFPNPGVLGYYAWVWAREPSFPNVGDAGRAGFAERVRVTARDVGAQELTVTRDGVSPIDLNVAGTTYWLVAPMNAKYIDDIDERLFDFSGGMLTTVKDVVVPTLFADQVDIAVATPGVGSLRFLEDTANGTSAVSLESPAALVGDVAITLLDALPGGIEFLQIDAAGLMTTTPSTSTVTLDDAYDQGGPGAGRIMLTTDGPLELAGVDGLRLNTANPMIEFETDIVNFNWRVIASSADTFNIQRGDQDADISDDVFVNLLNLNGSTRRAGINAVSLQDTLHVLEVGAGRVALRLDTTAASQDAVVAFQDQAVSRWEIGYDNSANGFVIGRLTFANPALFIADTTGRVGIGSIGPIAKLEIRSNVAALTNTFIDQDANGIGLVIDSESTSAVLMDLRAGAGQTHGHVHMDAITAVNPTLGAALNGNFWFDGARFGFGVPTTNQVQLVGPYLTMGGTAGAGQISAGVLLVNGTGTFAVSGEGLVADTLNTITESPTALQGECIILLGNGSHTITVAHGAGNILLDGLASKALTSADDILMLMKRASNWIQISFSNNAV